MATIVLGSSFGDEGKGKLVDILSTDVQLCCRAQGGHNAGHTVVANGVSYDFHLLPSGLLNPTCMNLVGSGAVVHVPTFFRELADLEVKGLKNPRERILLSDRCHIITDLHICVDGLEEVELGSLSIGTTKRGIGPTYSTQSSRNGITLSEMFEEDVFERKLRAMAAGFQKRFGVLLKYDVEDELKRFKNYRVDLQPFVVDAIPLVTDAQKKGVKMLVEGAQALMLDVNFGTYPYVTSSNTSLGGIFTGLALNPRKVDNIIGVVKSYTTRVGSGFMPTELFDADGEKLQKVGHEVGVSTGRPRRCGWLDLVVVKYSADINHYTSINLTKLDILDTFPTIKIAVAYKDPRTGENLASFPASQSLLEKVEVVYKEFEGWMSPTTSVSKWEDLPPKAQEYVNFIEEFCETPVGYIGTGPAREDMIIR
ncbi:hypothetical protein BROUX41_001647 [Berkeleyomyces rouxiae]|uniref:uncharacterized protein n=1 Tax=Berkeleyomyces rouxiae TaxID=2035830 RepID=UPI003B799DA8